MPATFFMGDPHFGHELVSVIRGYETPEEMTKHIVGKWVKSVKDDDTVYVMGDLSGGGVQTETEALLILADLPGRKRLISGNHDSTSGVHVAASKNWGLMTHVFESVRDYGRLNHNGRRIVLSHFPYIESGDGPNRGHARYEQFRLPNIGNYLIHAHTHHDDPISGSKTGLEICVSWDAWHRMVDMGDIQQQIKKLEKINAIG
jgi:calcineurin-like phosphoesterase family protein